MAHDGPDKPLPPADDDLLRAPDRRAWLTAALGVQPVRARRLQSLWRGYGELVRLHLDGGPGTVIVKRIAPPPLPTLAVDERTAHQRKLRSYEVERAFYERLPGLAGARTARLLAARSHADETLLVLEDLDAAGFAARRRTLTDAQLDACLRWLAAFHAAHVGVDATALGLWPTGCYWHLGTRPDELAAMHDAPLRDAAPVLDQALDRCRFRTLVHGDAKPANFCFAADAVAAVDFQYVGGGPGVRDLVYLLSCCFDDATCERRAATWLDRYFALLHPQLATHVPGSALEREWRALWPVAWADLHRFLDGWQPGAWPISTYTRRMLTTALADGSGPR